MDDLDRIKGLAKLTKGNGKNKKSVESINFDVLHGMLSEFKKLQKDLSEDKSSDFNEKLESIITEQKNLIQKFAESIAKPPTVNVTVPEIKIPKQIIPKQQKIPAPIVNVEGVDNTKELQAMTDSVNQLKETIVQRPKTEKWEVIRDNRGFAKYLEAVD